MLSYYISTDPSYGARVFTLAPHSLTQYVCQQHTPSAASDHDHRVSCKVLQSAEFSLVLTLSFV